MQVRVIETERAKYFFSDIHHIVGDGCTNMIFFHTLEKFTSTGRFVMTYGLSNSQNRKLTITAYPPHGTQKDIMRMITALTL